MFDSINSLISPVTGHVLCDNGKVLVGNVQGIAVPGVMPIGILPDLTHNKTWVGDASNRPVEQNYIGDTTFLLREANTLLPSAQDLKTLSLSGGGIIKVTFGGYIALAIPLIDYATQSFADPLVAAATASLATANLAATNAGLSATSAAASVVVAAPAAAAALVSQLAASGSKEAAIASAEGAHDSEILADNYYGLLLSTGMNDLPVYGDINLQGYRIKNMAQSPVHEMDLVTFKFVYDLINDEVDIT